MSAGEDEFVKRRIYLTLERGRDIALRNLFRKVFLAGGLDEPREGAPPIRRTRVPVTEFEAAMRLGNKTEPNRRLDKDEVECLLANLIYKVRSPNDRLTGQATSQIGLVSAFCHPRVAICAFGS